MAESKTPMGGADPTLVQAAFGAGMAKVPKDLSLIHQNVATAYQTAMTQVGEGFAKLGEAVGRQAGKLVNEWDAEQRKLALGAADSKFGTTIETQTEHLKDLRETQLSYALFSDERRKAGAIYRRAKNYLLGSVDILNTYPEKAGNLLKDGAYSKDGTGLDNLYMLRALAKGGDKTDDGFKAELSFDKETGEPSFVLYKHGKLHEDEYGNTITVKPHEFEDLMVKNALNVDTAIQGRINLAVTNGSGGTKVYDNLDFANDIEGYITNKGELLYSLHRKFGNMPNTFANMITTHGQISTEAFIGMLQTTDDDGRLIFNFDNQGDSRNVVDAADFDTADEYEKLVKTIIDPRHKNFDEFTTKKIFGRYLADNLGKNAFGIGKAEYDKAIEEEIATTPKRTYNATEQYKGFYKRFVPGTEVKEDANVLYDRRTKLDAGLAFPGLKGLYSPVYNDDNELTGWKSTDDIVDLNGETITKGTLITDPYIIAMQEGLTKIGEVPSDFDISGVHKAIPEKKKEEIVYTPQEKTMEFSDVNKFPENKTIITNFAKNAKNTKSSGKDLANTIKNKLGIDWNYYESHGWGIHVHRGEIDYKGNTADSHGADKYYGSDGDIWFVSIYKVNPDGGFTKEGNRMFKVTDIDEYSLEAIQNYINSDPYKHSIYGGNIVEGFKGKIPTLEYKYKDKSQYWD